MSDTKKIIELYTELAEKPEKDFGWDKGLDNAKAHSYNNEWFENLPSEVWDYCAAVGNPFSLGEIKEGSTVLDLGCGAGVDLLISALKVGENGKAIGVDITPKMVEKARYHAKLAGFSNVEVLESSFDNIELEDESVDVVISNGAINLTSCKESVFSEIYRVLKSDGRLMIADMIDISKKSDDACCEIQESSSCCNVDSEQDWANCVAGTMREDELIDIIKISGFKDVECVAHTHYTTADTTSGAIFRAKKIGSDILRESHWDNIFKTKDYTQVLWHQNTPELSLKLIQTYSKQENSVIDVGCGTSLLVDNLISSGYRDITLLDTSKSSLDILKSRLKEDSDIPKYICSDIMNFIPNRKYNIWHDRAAFHFLLLKKEREKYFEVLKNTLETEGIAILNTFSVGGQTECASLEIVQYDYEKMLNEMPLGLKLIKSENYAHITPKNTQQNYSFFIIKKI